MNVRIFDPEGVKPEYYKSTYPELSRISEFSELSGHELIFIWYFANKTSPIINEKDLNKRAEEALKRAGWRMPEPVRKKILKLQFDEDREAAITRMSAFEPGPRYRAWESIKKIFDEYEKIIEDGPGGFTKTVGRGDDMETFIDVKTYQEVSQRIIKAYPELINQLEEGFGVTIRGQKTDESEEGVNYLRDWQDHRQNS